MHAGGQRVSVSHAASLLRQLSGNSTYPDQGEQGANIHRQQWVAQWSDLVAFEIVPVVPGKDTAAALSSRTHVATR